MTTTNQPSFENVLEALGLPGRFQVSQVIFLMLGKLMTSFTAIGFIFMGHEPPHTCNQVNETEFLQDFGLANDSSAWLEYGSCHITVYINDSNANNSNDHFTKFAQKACPNGRNFSDAKETSFLSEWDLVCESKGTAELVYTFGMLSAVASGFSSSYIADRLGRKTVMFWFLLIEFALEISIIFSPNIYMIMGIRLLTGFLDQGATCAYLILGVELMVSRHRQYYVNVLGISWVCDILVGCGIAYGLREYSWRYFQGVIAGTGVISIGALLFIQESPRWLAAINKRKKALKIIEYACKQNGKEFGQVKEKLDQFWRFNESKDVDKSNDEEFEELIIKADGEGHKERDLKSNVNEKTGNKNGNFLTLFRNRRLLWLTFLMWFIRTTHDVTYIGLFMTSSNLTGNRFLTFSLMAMVEIPSFIVVIFMLDRMNRKTALFINLGLSTVFLIASTLFLTFGDESYTSEIMSTVLMVMGKYAISSSFNVVFVMTPELYPTNIRAIGSGVVTCGAKVGAMLAPFARPLYTIARWAPGTIFSAMCVVSLFMIIGLPETKDRELPNSVDDLKKRKSRKIEFEVNGDSRNLGENDIPLKRRQVN